MKIMKYITMVCLMIVSTSIKAATFRILNYSGSDIKVRPVWNRSNENWLLLLPGSTTKEYNTGTHALLEINWCVGRQWYKVDLRNVDTRLMLKRDFSILDNGYYQHTFVPFYYKFDHGNAELQLIAGSCQ